jgi:hypothetical protein
MIPGETLCKRERMVPRAQTERQIYEKLVSAEMAALT